jgi:hypothetical protein
MIRRQYITGSGEAFPFKIQLNGVDLVLGTASVDFKSQGNHTTSALSYHLSAASVSATVISVPYASIVQSATVIRGRFEGRDPNGNFFRSEDMHITIR